MKLQELYLGDLPCGQAEIVETGLYVKITCTAKFQEERVMRVYVLGEEGHYCLGVLMPQGEDWGLERVIPRSTWEHWADKPLVVSTKVPLRKKTENPQEMWSPWEGPLFHWNHVRGLTRMENGVQVVAIPYDIGLPLDQVEIFAQLTPCRIGGQLHLACRIND